MTRFLHDDLDVFSIVSGLARFGECRCGGPSLSFKKLYTNSLTRKSITCLCTETLAHVYASMSDHVTLSRVRDP